MQFVRWTKIAPRLPEWKRWKNGGWRFEKSCRGSSFKADRIRHLPKHGKQFPFRCGGSLPEISRGNSSVFDSRTRTGGKNKKKGRDGKKMVIPDEQVDGKVKWDAWNRGEWSS